MWFFSVSILKKINYLECLMFEFPDENSERENEVIQGENHNFLCPFPFLVVKFSVHQSSLDKARNLID